MTQKPLPEEDASPALRDARAIVARSEWDERDAEEARMRYRSIGLPEVDPDEAVAAHLEPGEGLVAVRDSVSADHSLRGDGETALAGPLYLTNRRLLVLAGSPMAIDLSLIDEIGVAGERLFLSLRDGSGVTLDTPGPRLLRVQIAAALMGVRG